MNSALRCAIYAGIVLATVALMVEYADADVCVYKPPKVRRVCGMIVDRSGIPIPGVSVTVLRDGAAVKNATTDENWRVRFRFDSSGQVRA